MLEEQQELPESSAGEEDVTEATPEIQEEQEVEASSSDAPGDEEGLLSVVRNAIEKPDADPDEESSDAGSPPQEEEAAQDESDVVEASDESNDSDDYSDTPFHKHPRFKKLIKERNTYREKAGQLDSIHQFMQNAKLTDEDVIRLLTLGREMKVGDPQKAYTELKRWTDDFAVASGVQLPEHLASKVEQGYMDQDTAQEVWQQQFNDRRAAQQAAEENQQFRDIAKQNSQRSVMEAVTTWETNTRANDPDYELKDRQIQDRVRLMAIDRGAPTSRDQALAYVQEAYQQVSNEMKSTLGARKQSMRTAVGGKVSGTPLPEPKSILDVIQNTLAQKG